MLQELNGSKVDGEGAAAQEAAAEPPAKKAKTEVGWQRQKKPGKHFGGGCLAEDVGGGLQDGHAT